MAEGGRHLSLRSAVYLIALLALAVPTQAQSVCGNRAEIIKALAGKYMEVPVAHGIAGQWNLAELILSPSGSWTLLMTQPTGITCILATGQNWEVLIPLPPTIPGKPT